MGKNNRSSFWTPSLPRSSLQWSQYREQDDTMADLCFSGLKDIKSGAAQILQSLHRMKVSVEDFLLACSEIFLLLANIVRVLCAMCGAVIHFVLAAGNIILLLLLMLTVIPRKAWRILFYEPGLVFIIARVCFSVLAALFMMILYIGSSFLLGSFVILILKAWIVSQTGHN